MFTRIKHECNCSFCFTGANEWSSQHKVIRVERNERNRTRWGIWNHLSISAWSFFCIIVASNGGESGEGKNIWLCFRGAATSERQGKIPNGDQRWLSWKRFFILKSYRECLWKAWTFDHACFRKFFWLPWYRSSSGVLVLWFALPFRSQLTSIILASPPLSLSLFLSLSHSQKLHLFPSHS